MNIDDIKIGDAKQLAKMFQPIPQLVATQTEALASGELCIVVADRGWVWVGNADQHGDIIVIEQARCVRRWGTTEGLAQLAQHGPQQETKLEQPSTVRVPLRSVVGVIPCEVASWK